MQETQEKKQKHTWVVREGFLEEFTCWPRPKMQVEVKHVKVG